MPSENIKPISQYILDANSIPKNKTLSHIRYATNKYYELNPNLIQKESQASSSIQLDNELSDDEFEEFDNEEFDSDQISIYRTTNIAESTDATEAFENLLVRSASNIEKYLSYYEKHLTDYSFPAPDYSLGEDAKEY
ncbi:8118_t:CDS:2, partial [Cetraspora pellucida]